MRTYDTIGDFQIRLHEAHLSDGSAVYNVYVGNKYNCICLHAITERDATELACKLACAIEEHTTETPRSPISEIVRNHY